MASYIVTYKGDGVRRREHIRATSHRVLKLACTIADLAGNEMIAANHVAEAV